MSDPILDIESTTEDCERVELVTIAHGTTTYRLTTGTRDIEHDGNVYSVVAGARGEIGTVGIGSGSDREMEITLPINHPLAKRYLQMLSPPKRISVTVVRKYLGTSESETLWAGDIAGMSVDSGNTEAVFRVPSRISSALLRVLPSVSASRQCPHTLFGSMCGIDRSDTGPGGLAHQITTTATLVNGRDVTVDLLNAGRAGTWAIYGELLHVASGEIMTITNQGAGTVAVLSLQLPVPGLKAGDQVKISAGCPRTLAACVSRFGNRMHFGGLSHLPRRNPHASENVFATSTGPL